MDKKTRAALIGEKLAELYPEAICELTYEKDYELLFAARLSAQCTDKRVNQITPVLFGKYPTLESLAQADVADIEEIIHSCGFFRGKASDISNASKMLLSDFGGKVPDTMEDLLKLPGVGRKTANLILGDIHGKPSIVVDTHCIRITNLLGLAEGKDPVKIENQLREILDPETSGDFCHRIVLHGRATCIARRPDCGNCVIAHLCRHFTGE
ncbi:MAG: endonuclease III [Oscillospiraceae bacterium]|nr:endonuclease III [Oscillospiraceae bacterium]